MILRKLKGLEEHIGLSAVHPDMLEHGWSFAGPALDSPTAVGDTLHNSQHYYELYTRAKADYTGRVTVPVLWDTKQNTIASNESAEIIRMFNSEFDHITGNTLDFYPLALRGQIDEVNERVYHTVNNGVYKSGFATTQEAYEKAFDELFASLDWLESRLSAQRFLIGDQVTEADWRLFTTLVRFDPVYVGHFKCNQHRIEDYPNLQNYVRDLYQQPGIAETVDLVHIKRHYYFSHGTINPHGVIPKGPQLSFDAPHDRNRFNA
jgi:putative glutathione S-transferase